MKQSLIEGWFLGNLSFEESQLLEELLLQDRQLRDDFRMAAKVDLFLKTKSKEKSASSERKKVTAGKTVKQKRIASSKTKNLRRKKSGKSKNAKSFPLSIVFSVAALFAICFGAFLFTGKPVKNVYLHITEITNGGSLFINGKEISSTAFKVKAGDKVSTPEGVRVKLKYDNENSSIELYENSEVTFNSEQGNKSLYLSKGRLKAEVAAQIKGKRMYLQTVHSQAIVLGTVFSLEVNNKSRLEVYEGKVQFESLLSGKKVYVNGGYFSEAGEEIPTGVHPLKIKFPDVNGKVILYVGGTNDLSIENSILQRLRKIGFSVKTISDVDWRIEHTEDVDLIIISASSADGNLGKGINKIDVPIISWHSSIFDNLGLVKAKDLKSGFIQNKSNGTTGTDIQMTNSGHPLSAGFNGHVTLFNTEGNNISWGVPSHEAAIIIATVGKQKHPAIFAFDTGRQMRLRPAPARRVALCYGESSRYLDIWTSDAWRLFDVSVLWALGLEPQ